MAATYQFTGLNEDSRPNPPANPDQIRAVEQAFHCTLPATYRLFLSIHNGWQDWSGGLQLLSTEQMLTGEFAEKIKAWKAEETDLPKDCLVIGFSIDDVTNTFLIDLTSPTKSEIVGWDYGSESGRYADFHDILVRKHDDWSTSNPFNGEEIADIGEVATVKKLTVRQGGASRQVTISIGKPTAFEDGDGASCCPYSIKGLGPKKVMYGGGLSADKALAAARELIGQYLTAMADFDRAELQW